MIAEDISCTVNRSYQEILKVWDRRKLGPKQFERDGLIVRLLIENLERLTEAILAEADHPSKTLKAPRAPKIPSTISHVKATVTMKKDGSADLVVVGDSSDAAQAKKDAIALTKAVDDATTLKISIIKVRAFGSVEFEAEGDQVVANRHVTKSELSALLGFAQML